ncbi:MAG: hypothetical protein RL095_1115 [Verrucomicrobiota bacterium]|jgi:flagellar motility protein MotE (MotC chaperone)
MSPDLRTKFLLLLVLLLSIVTAGSLSLTAYVIATDKRPFGLQTLKAFSPPKPLSPDGYEPAASWMLVMKQKLPRPAPLLPAGNEAVKTPEQLKEEEEAHNPNPIHPGSKNEEFVDKLVAELAEKTRAIEVKSKAQDEREKMLAEMTRSNQSLLAAMEKKESEIKKLLDDQKSAIDKLILERDQANKDVLDYIGKANIENLQSLADTIDKMRPDAQMLAIGAMDVTIGSRVLLKLDPTKRATILANMLEGKTKTPEIFPAPMKKSMREQAQQIMLEIKRMTEGKAQ